MNRRSFLRAVGLAPLAGVAAVLPSSSGSLHHGGVVKAGNLGLIGEKPSETVITITGPDASMYRKWGRDVEAALMRAARAATDEALRRREIRGSR